MVARLRLEKGDELYLLETPDGVKLTALVRPGRTDDGGRASDAGRPSGVASVGEVGGRYHDYLDQQGTSLQ